jgi:formate-dependent nitrite reductase cytochrome c552 subunit
VSVMDEPTRHYIIDGALTFAIGVMAFFGKRHITRIDSHGDRIRDIERRYVSREDLQTYMEQVRKDRADMHQQNLNALQEIRAQMQHINDNLLAVLTGRNRP